jgi:hypothetical protein
LQNGTRVAHAADFGERFVSTMRPASREIITRNDGVRGSSRLTRPTGNALARARWRTCGTQKDAPRGSRRLRCAAWGWVDSRRLEDRPHGACSRRDLETRELAVDPPVTPGRVLTRAPKHELAVRGTGTRSAGRRAPVRPTARQKLAVPAADRLRPNEQAPPAIARKGPAQSAEHDSVGDRATRPGDLAAEHRQLVAQHQDLDRLPVVRSATQNEQLHEPPERPVDEGGDHLSIVPAATGTRSHRVLGTHSVVLVTEDGPEPLTRFRWGMA